MQASIPQGFFSYKNKNKLDTIADSVQDIMNTLLIIICEAKITKGVLDTVCRRYI